MKNQDEVLVIIEENIKKTSTTGKIYRIFGYSIMLLSTLPILFFIKNMDSYLKENISFFFITIKFSLFLLLALILWYTARTITSHGIAYALRAGGWEDLRLFVILNKQEDIPPSELLEIILKIRRKSLDETLRTSLEDKIGDYLSKINSIKDTKKNDKKMKSDD